MEIAAKEGNFSRSEAEGEELGRAAGGEKLGEFRLFKSIP